MIVHPSMVRCTQSGSFSAASCPTMIITQYSTGIRPKNNLSKSTRQHMATITTKNFFSDITIPETVLMSSLEQHLFQLTLGNSVVQAIYVAAKLDIASLLESGPKNCDDLAKMTETFSDPLYRVLRFLTRFGIFQEIDSRCFALTPLAEILQDRQLNSFRKYILFRGAESYAAVGDLMHTLITGENAFKKIYGMNRPDYLKQNPDRSKLFSEGMSMGNELEDRALVVVYDFSYIKTLANLGGVDRTHVVEILKHYPNMKGIFLEESHNIETTRNRFAQAGLLDRCELVSNVSIESVIARTDACLINSIHRLSDQDATTLMRTCRKAMPQEGCLLIIEKIVSDQLPWFFLENDLTMLVSTSNGKLRTLNEFSAILVAAGFRPTRFVPVDAAIGLIEAKPESV